MYWFMSRLEFKLARERAKEVLKNIEYQYGSLVPTASIMGAVEKMTNVDVKFREIDFAKFDDENTEGCFSRYGAAMYVSLGEENREARILLNKRETAEMQRFSLVHELGHLILENMHRSENGFLFSSHIDMDITSIPEESIDDEDEFFIGEQAANIFALLVLIPYDALMFALKKYTSLDDIAKVFGVEKDAVVSRILLETSGAV